MHDLLRDLGREMADKETRQPTDNEMSRLRRLWRPEDLIRMRDLEEFQDILAVSEGKSFRCYYKHSFYGKYILGSPKTSTDLQWLQLHSYGSYAYVPEWLQNLYSLNPNDAPAEMLWEMNDQVVLKLKELHCPSEDPINDDLEKNFSSFGRFKNLESLYIHSDCQKSEWNWLLKSVKELTNLQTLRLAHFFAEGEFSLSNRGKTTDDRFHMRSLEAILLCDASYTMKVSISGEFCPTLKSLTLCSMRDLIQVDLIGVTTLECLTLNHCSQLEHVSGNDLPNLKSFDINDCRNLRELPKFGRVSCLKRIHISQCWNLQDISALENLKGLKKIWIVYCPKVKSIKAIEQLKRLNRIWIQGCKQLEDVICFKELKQLKRILIGECPSVQSVEGIEFLRCLESIIIARCQKMKNIRGIEELERLKEFIVSDSPLMSCVERLQRLPTELTIMVGRSSTSDFNADKIADTLSMVDAFCKMESGIYLCGGSAEPIIQSFQKTHHPLSAFIFCAVVSGSIEMKSDILCGTRNVHGTSLEVAERGLEWIYTCVVTEKMCSNYDWIPRYTIVKKAFLMGVKPGEQRKTLYILQSLFAQLSIQNSGYDFKVDEGEGERGGGYLENLAFYYDDFGVCVDDDEEYDGDDDDDYEDNNNVSEF